MRFWSISFPGHPFPDIRRAVQHWDALHLTRIEKTNTFDIHQIHLLQIQSYSWSGTLDLRLHLSQVLRSKRPAQTNPRSALARTPFNPQRHGSLVDSHSYECNGWAIDHSLHERDLEVPPILNFQEFLFGGENAVDWQVPAVESASL
jgi:hypothetical protein